MKPTVLLTALTLSVSSLSALADPVRIENAWARATAPGQKVAAAFMDLTADSDLRLVGASSPAAKTVELHQMRMDEGVMVMRAVPDIPLPKGQTVSLKPGGLHLMLIDLVAPLKEGSPTPVSLTLRDARGQDTRLDLKLETRRAGSLPAHHGH
ncbi:MAG: copper chaperone PCu(A)C [Pseudomonadota bacterium]